MPWLFIDTHDMHQLRLATGDAMSYREWSSTRRGGLLSLIAQKIGLRGCRSLDGICVVRGPGGFSCTRSGVVIANLLSRIFQIPLVGVMADEATDLASLFRRVQSGDVMTVAFVEPIYAMEPNITMPKTKRIA